MWSVCSSFKLRGHRRTMEATKTPDPSETVATVSKRKHRAANDWLQWLGPGLLLGTEGLQHFLRCSLST